MMLKSRTAAIASLALLALLPSQEALAQLSGTYCTMTDGGVKLCDKCVFNQTLVTRANATCVFTNRDIQSVPASPGLGYEVVRRPRKGKAGLANFYTIAYRAGPAPGSDDLEVAFKWVEGGIPKKIFVKVHVVIEPEPR